MLIWKTNYLDFNFFLKIYRSQTTLNINTNSFERNIVCPEKKLTTAMKMINVLHVY
jgi:hypothetical protein